MEEDDELLLHTPIDERFFVHRFGKYVVPSPNVATRKRLGSHKMAYVTGAIVKVFPFSVYLKSGLGPWALCKVRLGGLIRD